MIGTGSGPVGRTGPRDTTRRARLTRSERSGLLWIGDLMVAGLAVVGALWLWTFTRQDPLPLVLAERVLWIPGLSLIWVASAWVFDLYNPHLARRIDLVWPRLLGIAAVILVGYLVIFFAVAPHNMLIRLPLVYFLVLALVGDSLWRWAVTALLARGAFQERVLIVGAGWAGRTISHVLRTQANPDFEILGFIDDDPAKQGARVEEVPVLGSGNEMISLARDRQASGIIYAITDQLDGDMFQHLLDCQTDGLAVVQMPALYETLTGRVPVDHVRNEWMLPSAVEGGQTSLTYRLFVRVLDWSFGLLAGIFLALVGPMIALLIKLDSPGPIFYRQLRSGRAGIPFRTFKFRSMVDNAEASTGAKWTDDDDSRITRVGRFLRRTRLDELPQILNILRGDMHLIGPRPERPQFISQLEKQIPFYRARLAVKPGLTGWAQVNYRYGNTVEDARVKLEYDLYHIKNRSVTLDIQILFKTVGVMLTFKGT